MLWQYDQVDSTNRVAWDLVDRGCGDGTIVTAQSQTKGRGQRGRTWVSGEGGLYLSAVYVPSVDLNDPALLTIGTVWGIAQVLEQHIPGFKIKAPNDLMVGCYKLGGILTETRYLGGRISSAVIGVGINGWNTVPQGAISLQELDTTIGDLEQLRDLTIGGILLAKQRWERGDTENLQADYEKLTGHKISPHRLMGAFNNI